MRVGNLNKFHWLSDRQIKARLRERETSNIVIDELTVQAKAGFINKTNVIMAKILQDNHVTNVPVISSFHKITIHAKTLRSPLTVKHIVNSNSNYRK